MKKCTKCHKLKNLSEFYRNIKYKGGYRAECKSCLLRETKENYKKRSIQNKPMCRSKNCKNKVAFMKRSYCMEHNAHKIYGLNHKEEIGRIHKKYTLNNPEYTRERKTQWYIRKRL